MCFVRRDVILKPKKGQTMRKTNEELDEMIADQQAKLPEAAESVDVQRGHVSKSMGQLVGNRAAAIRALEDQKELSKVNLRAGI